MASNQLPSNSGQLIPLAIQMQAGVVAIGVTVGVTMVTAAQIKTVLDAFIAKDSAYNAARSAKHTASDTYLVAGNAIYDWLLAVRKVLAVRFGDEWSTAWAQAGFTNGSTAVPKRVPDRLALVLRLVNFFKANPTAEVASMNVTAARGTALSNTAIAARKTLATLTVALGTLTDSRAAAYTALVAKLRTLITNLDRTLGKNDPRWKAFGLNMPGANTTPGKPVNVTAMMNESGGITVSCDPVSLATRYRWRTLLVGVETDYRLAASSPGPLATITGVSAGRHLRIIVQAVNGTQQGVASDPIDFIVTAQRVQAVKTPPVTAPSPIKGEAHRNGSGNGKGRHALAVE